MKELISSLRWLGGKQILRKEFECDLPAPRLPHVAQVRLSASLKAVYGNQQAQAQTVRVFLCVFVVGCGVMMMDLFNHISQKKLFLPMQNTSHFVLLPLPVTHSLHTHFILY